MIREVFISSAHQDQQFRNELDKHLSNLKRQGIISSWSGGDITPVFPIILRPTDGKDAPFAALEVLPADGPTLDDAFENMIEGICIAIREVAKRNESEDTVVDVRRCWSSE